MAAALVPATGGAAQAGNALRTIISRLLAPTAQAANVLEQMGININDVSWVSANGVERIERLATAFNGLTQPQKAIVAAFENWWDKYRVTLTEIESKRDEAAKALQRFLKGLRYV